MDMSFLYTKAATHDKKVLNKVLTVNVEAVMIWQQWYQDSKRKNKREIKL
jgi:hypothetical protein